MKDHFNILSLLPRYILHTQISRLANYGHKALKIDGPRFWNELSDEIQSLSSLKIFKRRVKSDLLSRYHSLEKIKNYYYVSELSICSLRMTTSKMQTFFIPPYLPARPIMVYFLSNDNRHINIKFKLCSGK